MSPEWLDWEKWGGGGGGGDTLVFLSRGGRLSTKPPKAVWQERLYDAGFLQLRRTSMFSPLLPDRLAGLVVKASASGAEDPGFDSRLRRNFFRVESYQ